MFSLSPQVKHWLEKAQVQAVAAAAFVGMWFLGWPVVRPWDPQAALTFIPNGQWAELAGFAALLWLLAAIAAVATRSARGEGALLATMVGAAALSLHAGPFRTWYFTAGPRGIFAALALETLAMGGILAGTAVIVTLIRGIFGRLLPGWVWKEAPEGTPEEPDKGAGADGDAGRAAKAGFEGLVASLRQSLRPRRIGPMHNLACLVMELAVATILLVITCRSPLKGQVAFALAASFFLAALAAHQTYPVRSAAACWLGPIVMGAIVFALGCLSTGSAVGPEWHHHLYVAEDLPLRAAVPVDWMAFGAAGAIGGYWLSRRMLHARAQKEDD